MSDSKLGKCASAGLRPVIPLRPSMHSIPLASSCCPLLMVPRFQPSSCSARYATPSKTSLTVRAMNSRLAWPLSELAVSCNRFFNTPIFDIPTQHHTSPPLSKFSVSSVSGESLTSRAVRFPTPSPTPRASPPGRPPFAWSRLRDRSDLVPWAGRGEALRPAR